MTTKQKDLLNAICGLTLIFWAMILFYQDEFWKPIALIALAQSISIEDAIRHLGEKL